MDIILRNATIIDGTGAPSRTGDVGVAGDRIVWVGPGGAGPGGGRTAAGARTGGGGEVAGAKTDGDGRAAPVEIDCTGLIVAPGFIDIHSHSDFTIFLEPSAMNYLAQGVTLLVNGNCGFSGAPLDPERPELLGEDERFRKVVTWTDFAGYLNALDRLPKAVNLATLVGHGNVRTTVLGVGDRAPGAGDLEKMKALVREAMEAGALGLSTGLIYPPGMFATTEEIIELAKVAGEYRGLYATHMRSESDLLVEAVLEAIRVGREAGCRIQISHHKASGRRNWGLVHTTLDLMDYYRRFGVEVTCDVYPCTAGATGLSALFPPWTQRGGKEGFLALLKDPEKRERIKRDLSRPNPKWPNLFFDAGPTGVRVAESRVLPQHLGKSIADIAREGGIGPAGPSDPLDVMLHLIEKDFGLGVTVNGMSEDDVRHVMSHRLSMISSDAAVVLPEEGLPHPRSYRAFTRTLATYARDERVLTVEQAVHKMTGMPAWKLGLFDRGVVRPGAKADLAVFDLWGLRTASDFGDPHHLAEGMVHVMVNGEFVIRDGKRTSAMPGELVRRPGSRPA